MKDSTNLQKPYKEGYKLGYDYHRWYSTVTLSPSELEIIVSRIEYNSNPKSWETYLCRKGFRKGYYAVVSAQEMERLQNMPNTNKPASSRKPSSNKSFQFKGRTDKQPAKTASRKHPPYINTVRFSGNLGKDAEFSFTSSGKPIIKASFALWCPGGEKGEENTQWFDLVYWPDNDWDGTEDGASDAVADVFANMEKGEHVVVEGTMSRREYRDRFYYGITVTDISYNNIDEE